MRCVTVVYRHGVQLGEFCPSGQPQEVRLTTDGIAMEEFEILAAENGPTESESGAWPFPPWHGTFAAVPLSEPPLRINSVCGNAVLVINNIAAAMAKYLQAIFMVNRRSDSIRRTLSGQQPPNT